MPVIEYAFQLLEAGETWFDNVGLRLLRTINIDKVRLTRCALLCLPRLFADEIAAEILLENLSVADETMVGPAVPTLISMANPQRLPMAGPGRRPQPEALLRTYEAYPKAVENAITALLDSGAPYDAGQAARGITVIAASHPSLPGRCRRGR